MKNKKITILIILTIVLLLCSCWLYSQRKNNFLNKSVDEIYNIIVNDEDTPCEQKVKEMPDDLDFCNYETTEFFNNQPYDYYFETKQCGFSSDGSKYFAIAVIKLKSEDGSYKKASDEFNVWLNEWVIDKESMFRNAEKVNGDSFNILSAYRDNSAIVKSKNTIVLIYSNKGLDVLNKHVNNAKPLFRK